MKRYVAPHFQTSDSLCGALALCALLLFSQIALCLESPSPAASPEPSSASNDSSAVPILEVAGKTSGFKLAPELLHHLQRSKFESPATDHEAASVYEGVLLRDLLSYAAVPEGAAIRGEYASWVVILEASDGYCAAFSLAELDPVFATGRVLLADSRDGESLPSGEGPLRLVVPDEKRHARWIRQITRITVGPVKQ